MSFLFGSRQTPAEQLRKHQRALTKAIRDLDRERQKLEQQEKKVIAEIEDRFKLSISDLPEQIDVKSYSFVGVRILLLHRFTLFPSASSELNS